MLKFLKALLRTPKRHLDSLPHEIIEKKVKELREAICAEAAETIILTPEGIAAYRHALARLDSVMWGVEKARTLNRVAETDMLEVKLETASGTS